MVYSNFPDNRINAFCKSLNGDLWAGSSSEGLYHFRENGVVLNIYNTDNKLPDNTIHAIIEDKNNDLWISTNKGLVRYSQKTKQFRI